MHGSEVFIRGDEMAYIYCIKNNINNKLYIGKTIYSIDHRFKEHLKDAYSHKYNSKLHRAILKYGKECFYPVLIEECSEKEVFEREKYYIKLYNSVEEGYNISYGGEGESQVNFDELEELFLKGYNFSEISKITGHTSKTVANRLKAAGYQSYYKNKSPYKDKGKLIEFDGQQFNSLTLLAKYLKENIDAFKDKEISTIIKGISKNSKRGTKYCGYTFHRL